MHEIIIECRESAVAEISRVLKRNGFQESLYTPVPFGFNRAYIRGMMEKEKVDSLPYIEGVYNIFVGSPHVAKPYHGSLGPI